MPYNITSGDKKAISYFSSPFVNEIWIGKVPILYFITWFIFLDLSIPKMYAHFTKNPNLPDRFTGSTNNLCNFFK
jgi:hypothetical protein